MRRWCSGIMQDSHSCDPGSIPGRRKIFATILHFLTELVGKRRAKMPPERIELSTPGLQDQCSATEL